ncbi:MAG TPA: AraC family transcriptional regulator [Chryseolinea sp.]
MIFQEILPSPPLRHLIRNYLLVNLWDDANVLPVKPYPTRIEQALVFFARGYITSFDHVNNTQTRIAPNAIFGQQVSRLDFQSVPDGDFLMVMVIFQPGALHKLFRLPAQELTCQFTDAESIASLKFQRVNDAIANCKNHEAMIDYVEKFLCAEVSKMSIGTDPIDRIASLLLDHPYSFSLDWVAGQANLSPRQFERKFLKRIGTSPKLYSRISRFAKAFAFKEQNPGTDWLSIALQFGFTDYYHLSKDFKQFGSVTPNILVEQYSKRPEMVLFHPPAPATLSL